MPSSTSNERTRLLDAEEEDRVSVESRSTVADKPTPLPFRPILVLLLINGMQPLAFEIIFPFVNQMIVELGIVTDPERVGFYSGLIESIYSCMSLIAILPCSYLADAIGRKPVILGGMFGLAISVTAFGMSKSYAAMVLSRCIGGALGGVWACTRVMLGEMTDKSNQGFAFSYMGIAYRTGQIVGLPLGGLLAHPERKFPFFRAKFWYDYPFVLPCFVASALTLASVIMGYFSLKETRPPKQRKVPTEPAYGALPNFTDVPNEPAVPIAVSNVEAHPPDVTDNPSFKSILTPPIISLMTSNIAMCLSSETLFGVFPLFAFTPISSGGLGLSEAAIGTQMGIRAVLHIGLTGFYGPLQKRWGAVRLYQVFMLTWPITVMCFPLLNYLAKERGATSWPFNFGLLVFFLIWTFSGFAWIAVSVMVTDAAPSAGALARINGLHQMSIVLPQAIAPASVTSLFAVSIKSGIIGGNLIWVILFALTCAAALHSLTLREPNHDWRQENKPSRNERT